MLWKPMMRDAEVICGSLGKSEVLGKEPAPLPLCLMEMAHGPPWD